MNKFKKLKQENKILKQKILKWYNYNTGLPHSIERIGELKKMFRDSKKINKEKTSIQIHKKRHILLHKNFDELMSDFICQTGKYPSDTTLIDLIEWSYTQTQNPDHDMLGNKI